MSSVLMSVQLDVEGIIDDLQVEWQYHSDAKYNPKAFQNRRETGDWLMFLCPFHDDGDNPAFGVQTSYPYAINCFGCDVRGDIATLVTYVLNLPTELHGLQYIQKNYISLSVEERRKIDINKLLGGYDEKKRILPDSILDAYRDKWHPYLSWRGIRDRTLKTYEIGYDEDAQAVTFPVRTSNGQLRFIQRRSVEGKQFLNEAGVYKKDILYGLYYIKTAPKRIDEVYLNESIIDTLSCYECGMAACSVMGRVLFREQVRELLNADIKRVNLFFDNDVAGVTCALNAFRLLSRTPIRVNMVIYPGGMWGVDTLNAQDVSYKDANELLLGGAMKQIELVPFLTFMEMLAPETSRLLSAQVSHR